MTRMPYIWDRRRTIMNPDFGVISISILRSIYRVVVLVPFTLDKNDYGSTIPTANTNMRFKNPGTMAFAAVDGAVTSTSCMQSKAIILWATLGITLIGLSLLLCCLAHVWMVTKCFICVSTGTLSITITQIIDQHCPGYTVTPIEAMHGSKDANADGANIFETVTRLNRTLQTT
ncbi:uncharacterized protein C8R40DRAFT_1101607 [Lentinula edodes]|uniref:uncharacterized protein n=1 Tax=Lentinula edodes TaxID=5353 RepID=UPI001E8D6ABA|nr:uncharacterized protein C8R40DRAFT_1101607 [Lentinula edodes]KAH7875870.1 hypothetical protein C8R40DRAFT_1101607 [Lentinula edodes]